MQGFCIARIMKSSLEQCEPANAVVKSCFSDMVYDVVHCWDLVDVVGTIQVAVMHPCNAPRCTATNALASHSPPLMVRLVLYAPLDQ